MVTLMYGEDVDLDRRDRKALRSAMRWLEAREYEIESDDQARSLIHCANEAGNYEVAKRAQIVADFWDLLE